VPIYHVTGVVTGSKYLGHFEADSEEEAIEKAINSAAASVSMCHQCAEDCEDPEVHDATAWLAEDETSGKDS